MTDPEIQTIPWYHAIATRTPRGRKLRRRLAIAFALLTLPWTAWALLGWDPQRVGEKLGIYHRPPLWQRCHRSSDCTGKCAFGKPFCVLHGDESDPNDPLGGTCGCAGSQQDVEARRRPPPGCRDAVLVSDDGDVTEWKCSGGDAPLDGGKAGPGP